MVTRFRAASPTLRRDPARLRTRDRAVLRILNRAGAATSAQLAILAYGNRRYAQARLLELWRLGLLERVSVTTGAGRGTSPVAYRLSAACLRRLGYHRSPWRGPGYLEHRLDGIDAVCALVRSVDPMGGPLVQLWVPEPLAVNALPNGPSPDGIVVLAGSRGSAVVCLEIDEANQHLAPIHQKLDAYQVALASRPGWHALFVVPSRARVDWLGRTARRARMAEAPIWSVVADELGERGADSLLTRVAMRADTATLRELLDDPRPRHGSHPIGSPAWLDLLGTGGGEEQAELLM